MANCYDGCDLAGSTGYQHIGNHVERGIMNMGQSDNLFISAFGVPLAISYCLLVRLPYELTAGLTMPFRLVLEKIFEGKRYEVTDTEEEDYELCRYRIREMLRYAKKNGKYKETLDNLLNIEKRRFSENEICSDEFALKLEHSFLTKPYQKKIKKVLRKSIRNPLGEEVLPFAGAVAGVTFGALAGHHAYLVDHSNLLIIPFLVAYGSYLGVGVGAYIEDKLI